MQASSSDRCSARNLRKRRAQPFPSTTRSNIPCFAQVAQARLGKGPQGPFARTRCWANRQPKQPCAREPIAAQAAQPSSVLTIPPNGLRMSRRPWRKALIRRESNLQKTGDLERPGRGGRLHARVGRLPAATSVAQWSPLFLCLYRCKVVRRHAFQQRDWLGPSAGGQHDDAQLIL
jgi:hypothetical protein